MRLKHIGLGVIIALIAVVVYYVFFGSSQLTQELKAEVNRELQTLESQGFVIEDREVSESKEHFEIVFDDTEKITDYLNAQGAALTEEESASLKGMKVGVDLAYLQDAYSAISCDLYPTTLPDTLTQGELTDEEKNTLAKINRLFQAKTFLLHIDINNLLDGFKGYVNDIDETFGEPDEEVTMQMKAMHFEGEIDDQKVTSVHQTLESFLIKAEEVLSIELIGIKSNYRLTGTTRYDVTAGYSVEKLSFKETMMHMRSMTINHIEANTTTVISNDLAESELSTKIETIEVKENNSTNKVTDLALNINISNLDINAFEALQQADPADQEKIDKIVQEIISKGVSIEVPNLSVEKLYTQRKEMDGFTINAKVDIDKDLDLAQMQANPMVGISAIKADLNLSLSETLHTFISKQPQALIAMMMFQPKEENGKKVYQIKLENGILTVNGIAMQ
jgi:hypothetical protein